MTEPTMNQYAPPMAHVSDMQTGTGVGELKIFSSKGRIGRLRYLAYSAGAGVLFNLSVTVLTLVLPPVLLSLVALATMAVLIWFHVITGIKRCHDMDISGWWCLTIFIPIIALVWVFAPGSRGDNRFGPPPPANTWGVRLLALILPAVVLIGILAAVAIPQYKHYTDRARAAQAAGPR